MNESKAGTALVRTSKGHSAEAHAAREADWADLIARIRSGDSRALAALYDQCGSIVYGLALRILGNAPDAEETTMDVFKQVWRSAPDFDPARGSALAWIVAMARTRSLDRKRRAASRARFERPLDPGAAFYASEPGPEQQSAAGELRTRLRTALNTLSEEQRTVIELAFYSGFTHSELSDRLGAPMGTVKTRIRQGMLKLRRALAEDQAGDAI